MRKINLAKISFYTVLIQMPFSLSHAKSDWVQSSTAFVELGLWDRAQEFPNGFDAHFSIRMPSGASCKKIVHFSGKRNWEFVNFPGDFSSDDKSNAECTVAKNGNYQWSVEVNGKNAAGGKFKFSQNQGVLNISR